MKRILLIAGLLLAPVFSANQAPEWRESVVVRAGYGSGPGEFCYEDVVSDHPESDQAVPCYYVGAKGIFILDKYQGNIKVFDLSGGYRRTISLKLLKRPVPAKWGLPDNEVTVAISGADIVVTGGVIYLLRMMVGHPYGEMTKFSLYAIDLETGALIDQIMIHNPVLGTNLEGREVGGSVRIYEESEGTLTVYDRIRRVSYPLIVRGEVLPAAEHGKGFSGRRFGAGRALYDPERAVVSILDAAGAPVCECRGSIHAKDVQGRFVLTVVNERKSKDHKRYQVICDHDCRESGRIAVLFNSRKRWTAFAPNDVFRFGPDGGLYEIHVALDALYVYRWSP